jgi:hypothetical protein
VAITPEEIEREKKALPFGWGRFGKTLDRLAEISRPDESLLASCAAMNPEYHQGGRFVPGTAASVVSELTKSTNVVLACTNERLIMISTGMTGAARDDVSISYDGLEIVERRHRLFVLGMPEGQDQDPRGTEATDPAVPRGARGAGPTRARAEPVRRVMPRC